MDPLFALGLILGQMNMGVQGRRSPLNNFGGGGAAFDIMSSGMGDDIGMGMGGFSNVEINVNYNFDPYGKSNCNDYAGGNDCYDDFNDMDYGYNPGYGGNPLAGMLAFFMMLLSAASPQNFQAMLRDGFQMDGSRGVRGRRSTNVGNFNPDTRPLSGNYTQNRATYEPMVRSAAQRYGFTKAQEEAFVKQINQESKFNPNAVSSTGCTGIAQFTKGTGRQYGLQIGGGIDERRDPVKSLDAAARYMKNLHQRYEKRFSDPNQALVFATAAYNSGEGAVDKYLAGRAPLREEGRGYVKTILGVSLPQYL